MLPGCVSKVEIPAVDQFRIASGSHDENINAGVQGKNLIKNLYELMRANEGDEVPLCTAAKDSRQCVEDGFSVFVWGGMIPGVGKRTFYVFSEISLNENQLEFTKDNTTTFVGTPMYTHGNKCQVIVKDGGLQVQMANYYASWMGVGQMFMAEGWAIDYMDLYHGIVGLQLVIDIKGILTSGGGSRYVLLKFPHVPESLSQSEIQFKL